MSASDDRPVHELIAGALDLLSKFVVPLYVDIGSRPGLRGSGFFITAGSDCFLVSAAHVLDEALVRPMYFYSSQQQKRYLDGLLVRSPAPRGRNHDTLDIGVVKLGPNGRPPYPDVNKFPMDVEYLKPRRVPRTGREYAMIGFPETKNRFRPKYRDVLAVPYAHHTDSVPDSEYKQYGVTPESHILLPLNLRKGFDAANHPVIFPRPHGLSGSPIIVLHEEGDEARVFPVVGVGIEYRKRNDLIVATDAQSVFTALAKA